MSIGGESHGEFSREQLLADYKIQVISALDLSHLTNNERYHDMIKAVDVLLNKVVDTFMVPEQQEIVNALLDVINLHAGQKPRLSGETVLEHLLEVANTLLNIVKDPKPEEVMVALLHDAIEDRMREILDAHSEDRTKPFRHYGEDWNIFFASLRMKNVYGDDVQRMLFDLIKPDYDRKIAELHNDVELAAPDFQREKNRLYVDYFKKALDNPDVDVVKLSDFIANATDVDEIPDSYQDKREEIRNKYRGAFVVALKKLEDPNFVERLNNPDELQKKMSLVFESSYQK